MEDFGSKIPLPYQVEAPRNWRQVQMGSEGQAFAFDVTQVAVAPAFLLAQPTRRSLEELASAPQLKPQIASAWRLCPWGHKNVLYVLAAQGTQRDFENLIIPRIV